MSDNSEQQHNWESINRSYNWDMIKFPHYPTNPYNPQGVARIQEYVNAFYSPVMIEIEDEQHMQESEQFLKRFYTLKEFQTKIQLLSEYYKFHQEFPRMFTKEVLKVIQDNVQDKRILEYEQVKKKMGEGHMNLQSDSHRKAIEPHQRLLADIELSYEDFQNKVKQINANPKKQNHKELKRVISVHCKDGGFTKQCKQGLFLRNTSNKNRQHRFQNIGNRKPNITPNLHLNSNINTRSVCKKIKSYQEHLKKTSKLEKQPYQKRKNSLHDNMKPKMKSANVSAGTSLSRSISKSNLHNAKYPQPIARQEITNLNEKTCDRKSQSISMKHKKGMYSQTNNKQELKQRQNYKQKGKVIQIAIKPTRKVGITHKPLAKKSQSCKSLRVKTSVGILPPKQEQRYKKSLVIDYLSANSSNNSQKKISLDIDIQRPVNNMFKKVIQVRRR